MGISPPIKNILLSEAAALQGDSIWMKFPSLKAWIDGEKKPTVKQLAEFAKTVHIPFGYFFLDKLPETKNTLPLFRTSSKEAIINYSWELSEAIRIIERRQMWLIDYFKKEEADPLPFVGAAIGMTNVNEIAEEIRSELELQNNWTQFLTGKDAAMNYLIDKAEAKRIFVAINGIVGNATRQKLNAEEFKGFVLSNKWAPYIFINGSDFPASKLFTFMHELVHIWLDRSAVLDLDHMPPEIDEEKLCDAVAAELLVPENILRQEWQLVKHNDSHLNILEKRFKVSKIVIARRLFDLGIYTKKRFFDFYNQYKLKWQNKTKTKGGDFYNNQPFRVGKAFFEIISTETKKGNLLYTDAYKLTNLYGKTYHEFDSRQM